MGPGPPPEPGAGRITFNDNLYRVASPGTTCTLHTRGGAPLYKLPICHLTGHCREGERREMQPRAHHGALIPFCGAKLVFVYGRGKRDRGPSLVK